MSSTVEILRTQESGTDRKNVTLKLATDGSKITLRTLAIKKKLFGNR